MATTTTKSKRSEPEAVALEEVPVEAPEAAKEQPGVFCYVGPSIHGTIQANSLFTGTLSEVKAALAGAIEKHPGIVGLIVPADDTLARSRSEVKTNGTLLHKRYVDLASGKS